MNEEISLIGKWVGVCNGTMQVAVGETMATAESKEKEKKDVRN